MLRALVGPTASGKTEAAIALASALGADIVSVDSMLVYRGMDVGTAKPTAEQRARVPHHLLDLAEPSERFTVARFQSEAAVRSSAGWRLAAPGRRVGAVLPRGGRRSAVPAGGSRWCAPPSQAEADELGVRRALLGGWPTQRPGRRGDRSSPGTCAG